MTGEEQARYEWQLGIEGLGEAGQERLRSASVLVSRIGGVGGTVAMYLAAAGIGKLVLAHAGSLRIDDLNRQMLMSTEGVGQARVAQAADRLRAINPHVTVDTVAENPSADNVERLVAGVDLVASCAPLFSERLALNDAAVRQRKPLVDAAMYEMEIQLTIVQPGTTPCLRCLYPGEPPAWKRRFPVLGAVSGTVAGMAAVEIIKILTGLGPPLTGAMLLGDLRNLTFRRVSIQRDPQCQVCGDR